MDGLIEFTINYLCTACAVACAISIVSSIIVLYLIFAQPATQRPGLVIVQSQLCPRAKYAMVRNFTNYQKIN